MQIRLFSMTFNTIQIILWFSRLSDIALYTLMSFSGLGHAPCFYCFDLWSSGFRYPSNLTGDLSFKNTNIMLQRNYIDLLGARSNLGEVKQLGLIRSVRILISSVIDKIRTQYHQIPNPNTLYFFCKIQSIRNKWMLRVFFSVLFILIYLLLFIYLLFFFQFFIWGSGAFFSLYLFHFSLFFYFFYLFLFGVWGVHF